MVKKYSAWLSPTRLRVTSFAYTVNEILLRKKSKQCIAGLVLPLPRHKALADSIFESAIWKLELREGCCNQSQLVDTLYDDKLASFLKYNEKHSAKNGNNGHFLGQHRMLGDLMEYTKEAHLEKHSKAHPAIHKLVESVRNNPKLQRYFHSARYQVIFNLQ
ncbi:hypothetical protein BC830DRAFT_1193844 [Chytriomyces sp. MP71]|nr:hypothetical protein BC830DRAFT_1193844 [Chytriomyces sp. MP71]